MAGAIEGEIPYNPDNARVGYVPTSVAVACTVCCITATIDIPRKFDHKIGDHLLGGRIVKAFCPKCRCIREIRPFTPKELREDGLNLVKRNIQNYDELVREQNNSFVKPEDAIRVANELSEEYLAQLARETSLEPMLRNTGPGDQEDKPRIIIP